MKKAVLLSLCLLALVCLVACSANTDPPPSTTTSESITVTFVWQGGSLVSEVAPGTVPSAPTVPGYQTEAAVYTFTGWDRAVTGATSDVTYSALYSSTPRKYTVTFEWDNQTESFVLPYGTIPTPPIDGISYSEGYDTYYLTWSPSISRVTGDVTYQATYVSFWETSTSSAKLLDESLRSFKFQMSDLTEASYQMKCEEYMQGPDSLGKTSSAIDRLVYERNQRAADLLGVTVDYVYTAEGWGGQSAVIKAQTDDAASPDAADMFVYTMYDMVISCFNSSFRELTRIEGSYLDFESGGWYGSVMSDMSFDRTKIYVMASDYFPETYRNFLVLPFNLTMVDSATNELGSILLPAGQTLKIGEHLSDYLFRMVQDGKWTWDTLTAMCQAIYIDNNNDGKADAGDRMGIYMDTYGGNMASAALYSTVIKCLEDKIGAPEGSKDAAKLKGKLVPTYPQAGDEINRVFLAIGRLMSGDGAVSFTSKSQSSTAWFSRGLGMTPGLARLGDLDHDDFRNMKDTFSIVPIPLLVEGTRADYNTCIHNTAALGAFNINSPKYLAMSAYIQLVTIKSLDVKNAYLTDILRFDGVHFRTGTADMLELICSSVHSVREMILDNVLRAKKNGTIFTPEGLDDVRWHGLIKGGSFSMAKNAANGAFLDKYLTIVEAKQRGMNELMVEWYALPTAPAATSAK